MRVGIALVTGFLCLAASADSPPGPPRCNPEPKVVSKVDPSPDLNRAEKYLLGGYVKVGFTIDQRGKVRDPVVVESDPPKYFDREAIGVIKKWRFEPVLKPCYWDARIEFGAVLE